MTNEVLFSINDNGVASITLNRPNALNSLSYEMVEPMRQKLREWETDNSICLILLKSNTSKAFCAGGDIKTLYAARSSEAALKKAELFFEEEYKTDLLIHNFQKPIIACLNGIVMGGGVGLTNGATYRIVTETTKWAMPEMNIGFFPDVGAAYFLNKAPGHMGRYLALTASVIHAPDVLYINGADVYIPSNKLNDFLSHVEETNWHDQNIELTLKQVFNEFCEQPTDHSTLASLQEKVDLHFSFQTIEEIINSLDKDNSSFATQTKETLLSKSPTSLKVTLKQMIDGETKSIEACLTTDLVLAKSFMKHDDFFEGVRSILIDKDRNPQYTYKHISDVSEEMVLRFFNALEIPTKS